MKENILIFKPKIARHLLKSGFPIMDIKADKENPNKTIFVFKRSDELLNILHSFDK